MLLLNKNIKNGPPITDITRPTGISYGVNKHLPIVSAIKSSIDPIVNENGIKYLWSEPIINLPIWGTIKPTKEIMSATPVLILAKNTATADIIILCLWISTPKLLAVLSPKLIKLHVCLSVKDINTPIKEYINNIFSSDYVTVAKLPFNQFVTDDTPLEFIVVNIDDMAESMAFIATPANIILSGENPLS